MMKIFNKIKNSDFYKTDKEELIIVPLLIIVFYLLNQLFITLFPNSAFFDFFSQIETIVSKIIVLVVALWTSHLALRISFPKVYKFLHEEIYHKFDLIPTEKKIDYAIKFILVFILAAALVFSSSGNTTSTRINLRTELVDTLTKQLNVRETSPNRSPMIDIYNLQVGNKLGSEWCGAFVGSNLTWKNIPNPNSGWSPNYAKEKDIIWKYKRKNNLEPLPGDVVTYYYPNKGRVAHTGYFEKIENGYFITIEGNVSDGVRRLKRQPNKIYAITRYI